MLRRKPTRIELHREDSKEYEELKKQASERLKEERTKPNTNNLNSSNPFARERDGGGSEASPTFPGRSRQGL